MLCIFLTAAFVIPSFAIDDPPAAEKCRSAYLYCFENSKSLYEYNADETVYPTSTVKIMTGIVALEHFKGASTQKLR